MKRVFKFLADVRLTSWLLVIAIVNILAGSFYVKANKQLFNSLNHALMQDWFRRFGAGNIWRIWWLITLTFVLFLLGINTALCILDRMAFHWQRRDKTGSLGFAVKITPSLIHAMFGIMLLGHLLSMTVGYRGVVPVEAGSLISLPRESSIKAGQPVCDFYSKPFEGSIEQCRVPLELTSSRGARSRIVALAEPVLWNGYMIHLSKVGMSDPWKIPKMELIIKKDMGLMLIMGFFPALILLTFLYYLGIKFVRKTETTEG